jgi:tRNA A-37 threonylcarbamoyl transferase component Bud32
VDFRGRFYFSTDDDVTAVEHRDTQDRRTACEALPRTDEPRHTALFRHVRGRNYKAVAVAELQPSDVERVVASPESLLENPATTIVKRGRSALIVKAPLRLSERETRTAYKQFGSKTWLRRLARGLQPSRAVRNLRLGHELLLRGIATARPLLAVSPRWHALLRPGFLATEWLEGAVPVDVFLRATAGLERARRQAMLRETADCAGRLVGTLHTHGFAHRDLKATNLLVRERNGRIEVFVIDLDGASMPWLLTRRTRMTNLARLVVATEGLCTMTHALRRRALRAYLASVPDSAPWKAVWRELHEISRIRHARKTARVK